MQGFALHNGLRKFVELREFGIKSNVVGYIINSGISVTLLDSEETRTTAIRWQLRFEINVLSVVTNTMYMVHIPFFANPNLHQFVVLFVIFCQTPGNFDRPCGTI